MKLILCLLFLATQNVLAEEEFKVFVNTFDEDIDTSVIKSPAVKTTVGAGQSTSQVEKLPNPVEMEKIFKSADMSDEVKPLNQMDRDILFMKVVKRDLASVKKSYPQIAGEKLTNLKKIIDGQK